MAESLLHPGAVEKLWIGCSGWSYKHWRKGVFYPPELPVKEELEFYAQHYPTVEINYSFYQLPPRDQFESWRERSPEGFVFAAKASRYLTHMKKLKEPEEPLKRMMDAMGGLGDKLGPVLFQFPKQWKLNIERLREFLAALDRYNESARFAFEFRHKTWLIEEVFDLLRERHHALCLPIGWDIPIEDEPTRTADWTYIRFHGGQHGTGFQTDELRFWTDRIRRYLGDGNTVYAYFNNDPDGWAIRNADELREMLR